VGGEHALLAEPKRPLTRRLRTWLGLRIRAAAHLLLRTRYRAGRGRPLAIRRVLALRRAVPVRDGLASLDGIGSYGLAEESLTFLAGELARVRPAAVLELGSGESTLRLARMMADLRPASSRPLVFSVEQEQRFADETTAAVAAAGLSGAVRVACRPLVLRLVAGRESACYDLAPDFLREFLPAEGTLLIVVDGPAGGGDVRHGTIPLV
jgi:predicted O-methyltransferase YrrM